MNWGINWALEWWWALLLLPAPLLARRWLASAEQVGIALRVPLLQRETGIGETGRRRVERRKRILLWLAWLALLIAAGRPYWLEQPVTRNVSGRDLMLAVDISGSMSEADMSIGSRAATRLDVLKIVVDAFIDRRSGDRLGLILFGTRAYAYVPLTFDHKTLKSLLHDVSTGLAGRHTAIGDAIAIAIKSMPADEAEQRVLVLVTDGSNTSGYEDPLRIAEAAKLAGLTIHTIGVGSDIETLRQIYGVQNVPAGLVLNDELLHGIATITGGRYYRATDSERLQSIYRELDQIEAVDHIYQSHRPRRELFAWPLALSLLCLLALVAWRLRRGTE